MELFLIRHGETKGNLDKNEYLNTIDWDMPITNNGIQQVQETAQKFVDRYSVKTEFGDYVWKKNLWGLNNNIFPRIYVSPFRRTRETAKAIIDILNQYDLPYEIRENILLAEQQFGLCDGLSKKEIKQKFPEVFDHIQRHRDAGQRFWCKFPMGESRFDVCQRIDQFLKLHLDQSHMKWNIIVSHGTVMRAIELLWYDNLTYEWFEKEPLPKNGQCKILTSSREDICFL